MFMTFYFLLFVLQVVDAITYLDSDFVHFQLHRIWVSESVLCCVSKWNIR